MKEEKETMVIPKKLLELAQNGGVFVDENGEEYFICRYKRMEDFIKV
jgi:phage pi2 protein 07